MKTKRTTSVLSAFHVLKNKHGIQKQYKEFKNKRKEVDFLPCTTDPVAINLPIREKMITEPCSSPQSSQIGKEVITDNRSVVSHSQIKKLRMSECHASCGNDEAEKCFAWLINPVTPSNFRMESWEKKPLHIQHRGDQYYKGIFSCSDFDKMLRHNHLEFKTNIDIVSYRDGVRETVDADGRAYAAVVWNFYESGHSIRLLNPQAYSRPIWKLCSLLQEYFGSFVGVNMYLTPSGSQGFAPHYDDIEAFVLQIEGRKQWKVYMPRTSSEVLPRYSSKNFSQDEIGEPILEIELEPGDLLYFPRGFIHQAKTTESVHSLHLTLSTAQKNTWGDLLQKIIPQALETAMEENIEYRESLPKDYMNFMGITNTDGDCSERRAFIQKLVHLTKGLSKYLLGDTGAGLMMKDFIHSSLPPCLTESEKASSIHGNGEQWKNGRVCNSVQLMPETEIRFIRKRAVSVMREEGVVRLYHSFENSRIYKEREAQYVELEWEWYDAAEMLINLCPNYVPVEKLPLQNLEQKMDFATLLYDKGLIQTRFPLSEDSDDYES